jgi:ABC-type branched-subunit amino acid transport system ATPase component
MDNTLEQHTPRPILSVRGLNKSFGGEKVLDGVSLDLFEGEVVLLRGDNGCGKTTLLNILTGNLEPDSGSIWINVDGEEEHFQFPQRWWRKINPFDHFTPERVATEGVGRTWQDLRLFRTRSLLDNLAIAAPSQPGENPWTVMLRNSVSRCFEKRNRQECEDLLASLGLLEKKTSPADRISLGQTKRVAFSRAIRAGARVLFLDEPFSGLDAQGRDDIKEMLCFLSRKNGVTLVIVEHIFNIPHILDLAKTVWTLRDGIVQRERANEVSVPPDISSVIEKIQSCFVGPEMDVCEELLPGGAKLIHIASKHLLSAVEHPVFEVSNLLVCRNNRLVIGNRREDGTEEGISFKVFQGEVLLLCAPNGWGKTTLLEALSGIIPASQGEIMFRKRALLPEPLWKRAQLGLRFIMARDNVFPNLSVAEFMTLQGKPFESLPEHLKRMGDLSGGERKQLLLNETFAKDSLVMLDEPFLGLDLDAITEICHKLSCFVNNMNGTLIIALPTATEKRASSPLTVTTS